MNEEIKVIESIEECLMRIRTLTNSPEWARNNVKRRDEIDQLAERAIQIAKSGDLSKIRWVLNFGRKGP